MVAPHHTQRVLLALAVFAVLAIVHTWPLASAPSQLARTDNADAALNIWAVNWVGTRLFVDPARVFDANIFYPEKLTLAYSEVMLVQGAMAAPLVAIGASPVFVFNMVLLAGLTLTGWCFCLLVQRWTGSWGAGYVAGSLAAFNAHVLVRLGHLQTMHPEFIAVMLFALDRVLTSSRLRHALMLGTAFALQGLTSLYMLVFSAWALLFAALARAREWLGPGRVARVGLLAIAVAGAAGLMWPELWAYRALRTELGLARGAEEQVAASWLDYLATGARVHHWWVPADAASSISYAFPGITAIVLIVIAFSDRTTREDRRFRMCVAAAVGCVAISMAPKLPFYAALHGAVPVFQAIRVLARINQVVLLMIAVLAGFGVAALGRRWPAARSARALAVLAVLVNVEALRAPIGFTRFDGVPGVYRVLAQERRAVVVELPFPFPQQWFINAGYMLNSTAHWQPMLNGYSGFRPASYERSYEATRMFPAQESLIALHELGVTHVIVHRQALGEDRVARIQQVHELQEIAAEGDIAIYRLRSR
jgi:hypothetical protein